MIRLIRHELFKMSRRARSYIGFVAFLAIAGLICLGMAYGGMTKEISQSADGTLVMSGSPLNAEFTAWMMVGSPLAIGLILIMLLPFFVTMVMGEIVAGESAEGTIRALLTRPVTRTSVFGAKVIAGLIYTTALVAFMGVSAYVLGAIFFGRGGLLTMGMMNQITWFSPAEGLTRLVLAYGLTLVASMAIGVIALFISVWLSNSLGAIAGAIGLLFTTLIMGQMDYFKHIKPYLFGSHVLVGQQAFVDPIPWHDIAISLLCLGSYIVVLLVASLLVFKGKDVLA